MKGSFTGAFFITKKLSKARGVFTNTGRFCTFITEPPARYMLKRRYWIYVLPFLALSFLSFISTISKKSRLHHYISDTLSPFKIKALDHKAVNTTNSNGFMSLISGLDNDYYYADSNNRVGYLYIETRVGAYTSSNQKTPLNIAIVIDRSGSMGEDREEKKPYSKIEYAKKAAKLIVDKLDSNDYVSVTVYDNFVNVIQKATPDTNKATIKNKIDKISPRGATDLWGGTEKGYKEAMNFYEAGRINRLLLLSDGQANVGLTDSRQICKKVQEYRDSGISLSTFGVGLDYNELLMTKMAEYGSGNYYFIDSASKITGLFDKELNSLLHVAVQNADLKIRIPAGVKIEEAYPYKYMMKGNDMVIHFQDLSQGETLGVLVKFRIINGIKAPLKFTSTLSYLDVTDKQHKELVTENNYKPVKEKATYLTHFNKEVLQQAIFYTANDQMETAMDSTDVGNYVAAKTYLNDNRNFIASNPVYVNSSAELQKIDSVNKTYSNKLARINAMSKDSINWMQKINRNTIYKLKFKKKG